MVENKSIIKRIIFEFFYVFGFSFLYGFLFFATGNNIYDSIRFSILCAFLLEAAFLFYRKKLTDRALWIDNENKVGFFYIVLLLMMFLTFGFSFIPSSLWIFLPVYLLLSVTSSKECGFVWGTVFLTICSFLSNCELTSFIAYIITGLIIVTIFDFTKRDFKALPMSLIPICSLFIIYLSEILTTDKGAFNPTVILLPAVNLIASEIFILIIYYSYSKRNWYRYTESYINLNNWNNETLASIQANKPELYSKIIHTMHICEIAADKLAYDIDACKCASIFSFTEEKLEDQLEKYSFPPKAKEILIDYCSKKPIIYKETALLVCSEKVIDNILDIKLKQNKKHVKYDELIDNTFENLLQNRVFDKNEISFSDISQIKNIFKENKLYYDFIH